MVIDDGSTCEGSLRIWEEQKKLYPQFRFINQSNVGLGAARNRALGVFFSALLFGALLTGTSTRNLDATVFRPDLASNLTLIIQGLVVLFVGADVIVLYLWQARRKLSGRRV
jgi:glycosyltransferase involved in cell wall biosynthesis